MGSYLAALFLLVLLTACQSAPELHGSAQPGSFEIETSHSFNGFSRSYLLHVPNDYDPAKSYPLVVMLHGAFENAEKEAKRTGFSGLADREGLVVIYPNGIGILGFLQHWNAGFCCGKAKQEKVDDVGFVLDVMADAAKRVNIDPRRTYLVGYSNGGMLAGRIAALHPDKFAALATVAGCVGGKEQGEPAMGTIPDPKAPLPVLLIHGGIDDHVPYAGGRQPAKVGDRGFTSAKENAAFWVRANRCTGQPVVKQSHRGSLVTRTWDSCAPGSEVVFDTLNGWGHYWPNPELIAKFKGPEGLQKYQAAEVIWEFFAQAGPSHPSK